MSATDDAIAKLDDAQGLIDEAMTLLQAPPPEPPVVVLIASEAELDTALADAAPGATLTLSPSLVYTKLLTLKQPVTLTGDAVPEGRMTRAARNLPQFTAGLTVAAHDVTLRGLEVRHTNPLTSILVCEGPTNTTLDRLRILGDPVRGARRGVAANGVNMSILRCYIDDCFQAYPGNDSQAILVWNTPGPTLIEDNYLRAGSETVMLGGGNPAGGESHIPNHVVIRGNTITCNPEWQPKAIGVKSRLELKNCKNVLIEGNVIEQCWGGHGQDGYLCTVTVRNEEGRAPYSTIENVVIRKNTFQQGAAAINLLGVDNLQPSQRMTNVEIAANTFTDLNPTTFTGSKRLILVGRGPLRTSIRDNEFVGVGHTSTIYFHSPTNLGTPQNPYCEEFNVHQNTWPKTKYGVFGDGASTNQGWAKYVASGTCEGNVEMAPVTMEDETGTERWRADYGEWLEPDDES